VSVLTRIQNNALAEVESAGSNVKIFCPYTPVEERDRVTGTVSMI
jgi:hypothetical protein